MPFAYPARDDGKIQDINTELQIFRIAYKNGEIDVVSYEAEFSSSAGMYLTQNIVCDLKKGQQVKRGDILCYNKDFFQPIKGTTQVGWKHGHHVNVAFMETEATLEDSNAISRRMGEALGFQPAYKRTVMISKDTMVANVKQVGDEVRSSDPLMLIDETGLDEFGTLKEGAEEILESLTRQTPKAKYTGKIVKVDVLYTCEIKSMNRTLAQTVRRFIKHKNDVAKFAKGSVAEHSFIESKPLPPRTKIPGGQIDGDTVMITYTIQSTIAAGYGDKLVYDSSLKSVVSRVLDEPSETESGIIVDSFFAGTSISNRNISSPMYVGIPSRILEGIEDTILDMWFD